MSAGGASSTSERSDTIRVVMSRLLAYCACGLLGAVGCRFPYPDEIEPDATDDAATSNDAPGGVDVIAFVSMRDGNAEIYTMAIDGSGIINLTRNSAVDTQPLWSPAGDRIAFLSNRAGPQELYVMAADGSGVLNLSRGHAAEAAWSPDGQRLAFVSNRGGTAELYTVHVSGADPVGPLTSAGASSPDWSPDGTRLTFAGAGGRITVANADGTNATPITAGVDARPRWRPDGSAIVYSHRVTFANLDVFVVSPNGATNINITNTTESTEIAAFWSPDGTRLAIEGGTDTNPEIYVVSETGAGLVNLTETATADWHPRWSPDGTLISFVSTGTDEEIYTVPFTGGTVVNVTNHTGSDSMAVWRPRPWRPVPAGAGWRAGQASPGTSVGRRR